jgi:proteasome lid subunit RPN8/RPN11
LSWVSISKPVNDRIILASQGTRNEIIGLLLGRLEGDAIIIEDSITGEYSAEPHRATLPSHAMAKIADALVTGRIKGNIIGWYHSHTEGGLFFSETDIITQKSLQQFSSLITGMVDASNGHVGFFRVDPQSGSPVQIPLEKIRVFTNQSEAVPPEAILRPRMATPIVEVRKQPATWRPAKRTVLPVIIIVLVVSVAITAVLLYAITHPTVQPLAIAHTPVLTGTIGTPIEITANVTGQVKSVNLTYSIMGGNSNQVSMNSMTGDTYGYQIPGSQVTGNIDYSITALGKTGSKTTMNTHTIVIADFSVLPQTTSLTVYRNSTNLFSLRLTMTQSNGFGQPVSFSETGAPQGITILFTPNPATPGTSAINGVVTADPSTPTGMFPLTILGTYTPAGAPPVSKRITFTLTVSDFDLQMNPASITATRGSPAVFNGTLTFQTGFVDPVTIRVAGVPTGATYQLTNTTIVPTAGSAVRTFMLRITLPASITRGTYALTISSSGGGIFHSRTVQLIVR